MKKSFILILMAALLCACGGYTNPPTGNGGGSSGGNSGGNSGGTGTTNWQAEASFSVVSVSGYTVKLRDSSKGAKMEYSFGDGTTETFYPEDGYLTLSTSQRNITHTYSKKAMFAISLIVYHDKSDTEKVWSYLPGIKTEIITIQ